MRKKESKYVLSANGSKIVSMRFAEENSGNEMRIEIGVKDEWWEM